MSKEENKKEEPIFSIIPEEIKRGEEELPEPIYADAISRPEANEERGGTKESFRVVIVHRIKKDVILVITLLVAGFILGFLARHLLAHFFPGHF